MSNEQIVARLCGLGVALSLLLGAGCDRSSGGAKDEAADAAKPAADDSAAKKDVADSAPALPAAEGLLAKAVDAAGGEAAFAKFKSFYYEGELEVAGQKLEAKAQLWWKEGDFYTEQDMVGVGQVRAGKAGDVIWSDDPINGLRQLDGLEAEQVAWLSSLMLAADWKRYFKSAETVREVGDGDTKAYIVKLTAASGSDIELILDAKSGLQTGLSFQQATPMGSIPITLKMEDYRDFEGVKLAYKQITDMPLANATLEIKRIELNPEVSSARFGMPRTGADTVTKPPAAGSAG